MLGASGPLTCTPAYHAFGLIGTTLSKKISVFQSSSSKSGPDKPKRIVLYNDLQAQHTSVPPSQSGSDSGLQIRRSTSGVSAGET